MVNAPRASLVTASRYASPTSLECTAWKRRPGSVPDAASRFPNAAVRDGAEHSGAARDLDSFEQIEVPRGGA